MEKIPQILDFKEELISFLGSINLNYPPGNRFEESFLEIELALKKEKEGIENYQAEAKIRHSIAELSELRFIIRSININDIENKILKEKFKIIMSGERPVNKQGCKTNDPARNIIFELLLFSYLKERKLDVYYEKRGDIFLKHKKKKIIIECKRVNGNPRTSLQRLIKSAYMQLYKEKSKINFGIIALNINNIIFKDGKLLLATNETEAKKGFNQKIKEFIDKNKDLWQKRSIVSSPEFIPAVFICLNGTVRSFDDNQTSSAFFTLINNTSNLKSKNFDFIKSMGIN